MDNQKPCPLCGTAMLQHKHCFSHPNPKEGDCVLRHYSFDNNKIAAWNTRAIESAPTSNELVERVARAIHEARWKPHDGERVIPLEQDSPSSQEYAFRLARAAIASMPRIDEATKEETNEQNPKHNS